MKTNTFFSKPQFFICIAVLIAIAVYILVVYAKLAFAPQSPVIIQAEIPLRGSMFDRNKKPLAVQTDFYHLKVTPANVTDKNTFAAVLAPVTQLSEEEILNALNTPPARGFLYLKREIRETEKNIIEQEILKNKLRGISFDTVARRIYPEDALASQVIGFMGYDGYGLSGMELAQQDTFVPATGVPGESPVGNNVFLTIDANLQYKLEQIAGVAMENTQAESFMLVAASAKTGEVLSYISLPAANLNTYPSATEAEKIDRPAVLAYEPGSVFKIFSVAAFVDSGAISETERFVCDGRHEIIASNGERAVMTCLAHHGSITAREALQYSCNDALAQMSEKINTEEFLTYLREFGFGERTNVGLPSETRGSIKTTSDRLWSIRSKMTMSIGQELSVSALQMVQAATALANDGVPLQLSLISRITDKDGAVLYEHEPTFKNPVVSKSTADYLLSCMETTARQGTGTRAYLGDISIGVKTGTAQMIDAETGGYSDTDFVSNVAAVFPVDDPEIVLYIVITKAKGETYSGRIVAPVIAEAANVIIDHLGLARANAASLEHSGRISFQTEQTPTVGSVLPDFTGLSKRLLTPLLTDENIRYLIEGDGWVTSQNPPAGTAVTEGMTVELYLE